MPGVDKDFNQSLERAGRAADFLEFAELMLFLLAVMTYVNIMEEYNVFDALRAWLVNKGFSFTGIFWREKRIHMRGVCTGCWSRSIRMNIRNT